MLDEVRLLYLHLLLDLQTLHPTIRTGIERDISRLLDRAASVGLPFFTITLPSGAKWFDKSLSEGFLQTPRPPHFGGRAKSDVRPSLLGSLFDLVFEADGTLRLDFDTSIVISIRQILMILKKLDMECEERYTQQSVYDFHEIERSLPKSHVGTWDSDIPYGWAHRLGHPIWGLSNELDGQTHMFDSADTLLQLDEKYNWDGLRRFSARVLHSIGPFDPFAVRPKHGPGAISDSHTDFVKYDFRYWTEKLECVFPYDWHGSTSLSVPDYVIYREFESKMHAVPKTQSGPRLIAAEPTAHQWIQQGIRRWLEDSIASSPLSMYISLRNQEHSKELALFASTSGDLTTVDLSSASDRLTTRLVEFVFQSNRNLLDGLHAARTRAMSDIYGEFVLLRKFSTQGSAVIFPLQTYVYTVLALWACAICDRKTGYNDIISSYSGKVRVFGDDIIIPTYAYPVLKGLFETLLLKVNASKTHSRGLFRESCGMDAFSGIDVTPAYLRSFYSSAPESLVSIVEASNNFHKKGYWNVASYLIKTVPRSERKLIPIGEGLGSVCQYSFCGESVSHLKKRWDQYLHRETYRAITVEACLDYDRGNGNGGLTQYLFEIPDPLLPYCSGQAASPRLRKTAGWVSTER